jgi:hypothetical protein
MSINRDVDPLDAMPSPVCPACETAYEPWTMYRQVTFCPNCYRTLVVVDGLATMATSADVNTLTPGAIAELRKARNAARRAKGLIK